MQRRVGSDCNGYFLQSVHPSDVKNLTGDFGKVFRKTCAGETKENIGRWRQALAKVATVAGYHSSNWLVLFFLFPLAL